MKNSFSSEFLDTFGPHLSATERWKGFCFVAERLIEKRAPIMIVETGTIREGGNWAGDGGSTLVWDWLVQKLGGAGFSVDINDTSVKLARGICSKMNVVCEDSLLFLRKFERAEEIDFLYLDSYDFNGPLSPLHHVAELGAIYERLRSGCIIAVDDCHNPNFGKQTLVKSFFEISGIAPVIESYVTVWVKP